MGYTFIILVVWIIVGMVKKGWNSPPPVYYKGKGDVWK